MSRTFAGCKLRLRCPKCKSSTYELREHYAAQTIYAVKDGVMPNEATDHYTERTTGITATCKCGHTWTARGAQSLGDVVVEDDDMPASAKT